jgi:hypothetical protein
MAACPPYVTRWLRTGSPAGGRARRWPDRQPPPRRFARRKSEGGLEEEERVETAGGGGSPSGCGIVRRRGATRCQRSDGCLVIGRATGGRPGLGTKKRVDVEERRNLRGCGTPRADNIHIPGDQGWPRVPALPIVFFYRQVVVAKNKVSPYKSEADR